jgi:hypothetical protein
MTDFILNSAFIGPQKTGTTWLYTVLSQHPTLCFPKNVKETMFFELYYEQGLSRYESYFSYRQPSQLCSEVAPTYFDVPETAARIHQLNPDCKILISLRHPAHRAFSLYCHHLRKGRVLDNFEQAIEQIPRILTAGHYKQHTLTWLQIFGSEKVKFVLMDDIKAKPQTVISEICEFIGISEADLPKDLALSEKINEASMPKFPWLAKTAAQTVSFFRSHQFDLVVEAAKSLGLKKIYSGGESKMPQMISQQSRFLIDYYEDDISYVETLLGRDLSSWRHVSRIEDETVGSVAAKS